MPLQTTITSDVRPAFVMLLCTAALVLLIACANVANLLLARGNTRAREMAIRTALGAQSTQLVRLMLTESSLLAFAGCASGLALAMLGISVVQHVVSDLLPHTMRPELDVRVFVFSVCLTCACALLFGLLPSSPATRF